MKLITFTLSTLLLAGVSHAEIIDGKDTLSHDFQKLSSNGARHLALLAPLPQQPSFTKPSTPKPDMKAELFGLVGVGMVGLATRRRKRLF
jgi:hypothetical protein